MDKMGSFFLCILPLPVPLRWLKLQRCLIFSSFFPAPPQPQRFSLPLPVWGDNVKYDDRTHTLSQTVS